MAKPKKDVIPVTSPKGTAVWPFLTKADTKYDADGVYRIELVVPEAEAEDLVNLIDSEIEKALAKAKKENPAKARSMKTANAPYEPVVDDQGNETGEIKFKFKMKAKITKEDGTVVFLKPALFDAKGVPLAKDVIIRGGSQVKVAGELIPYYAPAVGAGVSLRLKAVQVIELVANSRSAKDYGFGVEEGFESGVEESQEGEEESVSPTSEDYDF